MPHFSSSLEDAAGVIDSPREVTTSETDALPPDEGPENTERNYNSLRDHDLVSCADLLCFAWQISRGMVRIYIFVFLLIPMFLSKPVA